MDRPRRASDAVVLLGHYAITPALYLASISVLGYRALWAEPDWLVVTAIGLLAWAIYIADRVKLKDDWLDPADAKAEPLRQARLARRAKPLRIAACIALVAATALLTVDHPLLALMPPLGLGFIWLYAGAPFSHMLKRRLLVKTPLTAVVIAATGLVPPLLDTLQSLAPLRFDLPPGHLGLAAVALFAIAGADVIACDIDHTETDRTDGVRSIPSSIGRTSAAVGATVLMVLSMLSFFDLDAPVLTVQLIGLSAIAVTLLESMPSMEGRLRHRDWIEWRLILVATIWI